MRFVYDQPPTLLKILRTTKENNKNLNEEGVTSFLQYACCCHCKRSTCPLKAIAAIFALGCAFLFQACCCHCKRSTSLGALFLSGEEGVPELRRQGKPEKEKEEGACPSMQKAPKYYLCFFCNGNNKPQQYAPFLSYAYLSSAHKGQQNRI